jgi:hypothetical protein
VVATLLETEPLPLSVPAEVETAVAAEVARLAALAGRPVSAEFRQRLLNDWALSFVYGGRPVACARTNRGVIVYAIGADDIRAFFAHFPNPDARPAAVVTTPPLWQQPNPPN